MKELIDHIPFVDVIILVTVGFFIYLGWKQGTPKTLMMGAAAYCGFLLASIYYHLFAVALGRTFHITSGFVANLMSFLILDVVITLLMMALLLGLFSHVMIGGRLAIFDRIGGVLAGVATSVLLVGIFVMMLHTPYEDNKQDVDLPNTMPFIILFNDGYEKSLVAPQVTKLGPYIVKGVAPMLPAEVKDKGAVPLLQSVVAKKDTP